MIAAKVERAVTMFVSSRGTALVRHAQAAADNDNMRGAPKPDDAAFFLALGMICIGVVLLAAYVLMSG